MNKTIGLLLLIMLAGCTRKVVNIDTFSTTPLFNITKATAGVDDAPSQIKLIDETKVNKATNVSEVLNHALREAKQRPQEEQFLNATTVYDFIPGSVYQIYTAPHRVSMISFEQGEVIGSAPQSGDTVRWQINNILSGVGANVRQHLVIKPLRDGLTNNMIITTNKGRVYLLELISLKHSYMTEIIWNYAPEQIVVNNSEPNNTEEKLTKKLNFNYKIINKRGKPSWRPSRVFDDGQKTFIQFPASINQNELPCLFIVTKETSSQLVNYRQQGDLFMVDRLFQTAELRLGLSHPEIIRIKRIER